VFFRPLQLKRAVGFRVPASLAHSRREGTPSIKGPKRWSQGPSKEEEGTDDTELSKVLIILKSKGAGVPLLQLSSRRV
jgi:hypothetical protein